MDPRIILLALTLSACDDEVVDDTSPEADTDTDTDADTDTDTDADTDADVDADLTFVVEGDFDGTVLSLNWFSPGSEEPPFDRAPLAAVEVSAATQGIAAGEPPSADLVEPDAKRWPGFQVAMYLPALHEDSDTDRVHDDTELWVGVGAVFPTWVAGTIPAEFVKMGLTEGWNAVQPGPSGFETDATLYPVTAIPLAAHLWPGLPITVGGSFDLGGSISQTGLVLASMGYATTVLDTVFPLTDPWSLTLADRLPTDLVIWDAGVGVGAGWPVAFTDLDKSGGYSEDDALAGFVCDGDAMVMIGWAEPPTDLLGAFYTDLLFGYAGWAPVVVDMGSGEQTPVDPSAWMDLSISLDCNPF
ncbi:MAG: hypothetical protein JXB39_11860 [Deltaproteobacteria bacterium]|nr:hypothetical protein [Deltaproteobacteria bacterium]